MVFKIKNQTVSFESCKSGNTTSSGEEFSCIVSYVVENSQIS